MGKFLRSAAVAAVLTAFMVALPMAASTPATAAAPAAATFNPNLLLKGSNGAGEPSIRTDDKGQSFVIGPIGVPAGCKAFRVTHDGSNSDFLGFPDHTAGGGDCDWALGPKETSPTTMPSPATDNVLAYSSLTLGNITVGKSDDGGATFGPPNVASTQAALDDRMWQAADPQLNAAGLDDMFMTYHDLNTDDIQMSISVDGGQTYGQGSPIINNTDVPPGQWAGSCPAAGCIVAPLGVGAGNELGNIVARRDPTSHQLTLYSIFTTPNDQNDNILGPGGQNRVYEAVGTVTDTLGGTPAMISWRNYEIWHGPLGARYDRIFPVTAVDSAGHVYAIFTDGKNTLVKSSVDGTSWSPSVAPTAIPNPAGVNTTVFPWAQAGKDGIVDVVFYGATGGAAGDNTDHNALWNVYMAQTVDGGNNWGVFQASDHQIHKGIICTGGTNCSTSDRVLLDFFQVSIDPTNGAADITYTDDHSSPGNPVLYFTRQCTGASATTGNALVNDCKAPSPPPPPPPGSTCPGPQIVDFTGDAPNSFPGGDGANADNFDIVNASFATSGSNLQITLTIKNLTAPPPPANLSGAYWAVYWDFGGNHYIAEAVGTAVDQTVMYSAGTYDGNNADATGPPAGTGTTITGSFNSGPNGTIVFNVPFSAVGDPSNGSTLTNLYADTHGAVLPPALAGGVYWTAPADTAPDSSFSKDKNGNLVTYKVGQTCPPPTSADLSVTKTASSSSVNRGGQLTYTITAHNAGPNSALNAQVTDTLPSDVTFVSDSTTQGSCSGTTTVTCGLGTLASGSTATVTIRVTVKSSTTASSISNTASVSSDTPDPSSGNNQSTVTTTVNQPTSGSADVSVMKTDSPDPATPGGPLTYTIAVSNSSPDAAQTVQMTDTLPSGVTFASDSTTQGTCTGTSTVTCDLGTINSSSTVTVTINVTVNPDAPSSISNTASASSSTSDPNTDNNSSTATTTVTQGTRPPGFSSISSNFNGTAIKGGNCIWFNSVIKLVGTLPSSQRTISFKNSTIQFAANGQQYNLSVPDSTITFDPNTSTASVSYTSGWTETEPMTGENVFLDGLMYKVPSGGLPGGIKPVTWSGTFSENGGPVQLNWQWAAAVYTSSACPASNPASAGYYNGLGVKPLHSNSGDAYPNGDQAGTPEHIKPNVTGGATGGGSSNYTGGYSGTAQIGLS
jgi:uncharacterized repeat protein (TIGR01451 family)